MNGVSKMKKHGKNRAKNKEPTKFQLKLLSALLFAGVVSLSITSPPVHATENTEVSVNVPSEMSVRFNEDGSATASNFSVRNASLVPIQLNGFNTSMQNGWTLSDGTTFNKNQKAFHLRLDNQIIRSGTNSVNINVPDNSTKTFRVGFSHGVYTQSIANTTAMTIETTYTIGKKDFSLELRDSSGKVLQTLTGKNGDTITLPNLTNSSGEQVESYTSTKTGQTYYPGNNYTIPIGGDSFTITWGAKPVTINATAGWLVHVPQANTENTYGYTLPSELNKPGYVVDYYTSNDTAYGNDYTGHQFEPYDTIKIPENGVLNLKPHFRKLNDGEHIIAWDFGDRWYHSYTGSGSSLNVHVNIASNTASIPRTFTESNPYIDVPAIQGANKSYTFDIDYIYIYDKSSAYNNNMSSYSLGNIKKLQIPDQIKTNDVKLVCNYDYWNSCAINLKNASKYENEFDFNVPYARTDSTHSQNWQGVQKIPNAKADGKTFLGWKNDVAYYDQNNVQIPANSTKKDVTIMNHKAPSSTITFTAVYDKKAVTYKDESGKILKETIIPNTQTSVQLQPPTVNGQWLQYMTIESEASTARYYRVYDKLNRNYYFNTSEKAQAFANTSNNLAYIGLSYSDTKAYYYPNDTINIDQDTTIILHTIPYRTVSFEKKNSNDPTVTQPNIQFKSGVDSVKLPDSSNEDYYVTGYVDKNSSKSYSNGDYYVTKDNIKYYFKNGTDAINYARENGFSDTSLHGGSTYMQVTYYPNQTIPADIDKDLQLQVEVKPYVHVNYSSGNSGLNFPPTKTKEGQTLVLPDLPYDDHYVDHYTDENGNVKYPGDTITIGTNDITLTPTFAPTVDKSVKIDLNGGYWSLDYKTLYYNKDANGNKAYYTSEADAKSHAGNGYTYHSTESVNTQNSNGQRLLRYYNPSTNIYQNIFEGDTVPAGYVYQADLSERNYRYDANTKTIHFNTKDKIITMQRVRNYGYYYFSSWYIRSGNIGGSTSSFNSTIESRKVSDGLEIYPYFYYSPPPPDYTDYSTVYYIRNPHTGEKVTCATMDEVHQREKDGWVYDHSETIKNTTSTGKRLGRYYNPNVTDDMTRAGIPTHMDIWEGEPVPAGYQLEYWYSNY